MIPLDISGAGLFGQFPQFVHVVSEALKLVAGSFAIVLLTGILLVGAIVYSIYKAVQQSSVTLGLRLLLHYIAYVIGTFFALLFVLVAAVLFSISIVKALLIAGLIVLVSSFLVKEFILFYLFARFGKYLFYITSLRQIHQTIFNGEEKN